MLPTKAPRKHSDGLMVHSLGRGGWALAPSDVVQRGSGCFLEGVLGGDLVSVGGLGEEKITFLTGSGLIRRGESPNPRKPAPRPPARRHSAPQPPHLICTGSSAAPSVPATCRARTGPPPEPCEPVARHSPPCTGARMSSSFCSREAPTNRLWIDNRPALRVALVPNRRAAGIQRPSPPTREESLVPDRMKGICQQQHSREWRKPWKRGYRNLFRRRLWKRGGPVQKQHLEFSKGHDVRGPGSQAPGSPLRVFAASDQKSVRPEKPEEGSTSCLWRLRP